MKVIVSGALANTTGITNNEFIERMKSSLSECDIYKLHFDPNRVVSASFDWKLVFKVSAILGIASFFWQVYSEIKEKENSNSNSKVIINIINMSNNHTICIGEDIKTEEQLKKRIEQIRENDSINDEETERIINEIGNSKCWKKVK